MRHVFCLLICALAIVVLTAACFAGGSNQDSVKEESSIAGEVVELLQQWVTRDGYRFLVLGEQLFDANLKDPNTFYEVFAEDSAAFEDYVRTLPTTCFTNQNDTVTVHLEKRRLAALEALQATAIDSAYLEMHRTVLDTLRNLKVSFVD